MLALALCTALNPWLAPAPAPVDNPLKGLVPYQGQGAGKFPHSMEFSYLPLAPMSPAEGKWDWAPLEGLLNDVASRRNQTVFRVYLEYPGEPTAVPGWLLAKGVKLTDWRENGVQGQLNRTPDYSDARLEKLLVDFIRAMGQKYDGDPRIGFITGGLIGLWGEWHTWPREDLNPPRRLQQAILDAYQSAFKKTPVLLRYPSAGDDATAPNHQRPFGYHDDSFAFATLDDGRPESFWHYMAALKKAGPEAGNKWRAHPIGGEIRPEVWGRIFDEEPGVPHQPFEECLRVTRASWLMDSGMFREKPSPERAARASAQVRLMGYEFAATTAALLPRGSEWEAEVVIASQGLAPFYADWPLEAALLDAEGKVLARAEAGRLRLLQPGESMTARALLPRAEGAKWLAIGCQNPMPGGRPVGFANAGMGAHAAGWLTVDSVN
jgi:hypothetical protein